MNLEQSDSYKANIEKNARHKKIVMLSIVLCAILVAFLFIIIIMIEKIDATTMKIYLDDRQLSNFPNDFIIKEDNVWYFNIKELGQDLLGYKYYAGEYKNYNENKESCYLENNYEIIAITAEQDYYRKYNNLSEETMLADIQLTSHNDNNYNESFFIEKTIKLINDELYVPVDNISDMFNITFNWNDEYRLKFYTLEYNVKYIQNKVAKANYANMDGSIENLKASLDGFAIVGNPAGNLFGIYSINNNTEITGLKYKRITYIKNTKQFYITAEDDTIGIVDSTGNIIVPVKHYSKISLLDERKQFYLVKEEKQYGILDSKGKEIVFANYDEIGIDVSKFALDKLLNGNILYDSCIPFYKENDDGNLKYGLLDINGKVILENYYDGFGYKSLTESPNSNRDRSALLIPETVGIKGIIVELNGKYGVYDVEKKSIVLPTVFTKIYAAINDGVVDYYVEEENGNVSLLSEFLAKNGLL